MDLSDDERALLREIAASPKPVAMSDFFHELSPPPGPFPSEEGAPKQEAWTQRQIDWYGVSLSLWRTGCVRVVSPANGERPDLVEATGATDTI
ncbi:hypothetical protein [Embleya hyalina]|uniref:Uncharacterized protein n=1 Tax=Embleya hyalina TaxID=516124 RepID=A0A401Z5U9_9ACTN|nr:hypothetical protein [Embleya hyalina]GCE02196.1 hypothetical protein EHYA_09973 [Embleya hyalina]